MRHSSIVYAFLSLIRSRNNAMPLWENAEPISLDELKARFAALARTELANKPDQFVSNVDELNFEELWKIFESLEDLEDCPLIY